jgi:acyl-CoA hydrolase
MMLKSSTRCCEWGTFVEATNIRTIMEIRKTAPLEAYTTRLVKSEDLNHHGTLFAGRTAEWFVESGFIAAAMLVDPTNIVCLKIHGMYFTKPVKPGEIIRFTSKIVCSGNSSLVAHISVSKNSGEPFVSGFITFIHVDEHTRPSKHLIEIIPVTEEDKQLYQEAKGLNKK